MAKNKKGKSGPPSIHKKPTKPTRHEEAAEIAVYSLQRLLLREHAKEEARHPKEIVYTLLDERGVPSPTTM